MWFVYQVLALAAFMLTTWTGDPVAAATSTASLITLDVDFASFLAGADPIWNWTSPVTGTKTSTMNSAPQQPRNLLPPYSAPTSNTGPTDWVYSLFGGNGELGFYIFKPTPYALRMEVSRQSLYDDRNSSLGARFMHNFVYDTPRLPVGYFDISMGATIIQGFGRIALYDGCVWINISTTAGTLTLSAWANAEYTTADVIVLQVLHHPDGLVPVITFVSEVCESTWADQDKNYVPNPPPLFASAAIGLGAVLNTTTQLHLLGTSHSTAVLQDTVNAIFYLAISPVSAEPALSDSYAQKQVHAAYKLGLPMLQRQHLQWWHDWWPRGGFITTEFSILEGFFYTQVSHPDPPWYSYSPSFACGTLIWLHSSTRWPALLAKAAASMTSRVTFP